MQTKLLPSAHKSQTLGGDIRRRWTVLPPYINICNNLLPRVSAHKYMLPCIQQLLLKTSAECCAARTLNAVARCGCLLGVAVVECVAGAAGCLRGCCDCLPMLQDMAALVLDVDSCCGI